MTASAAPSALTPLQQGMLFHHLLDPAGGTDIEQIVVALPERVDATALRSAWEGVVARHEVLRTAFHAADASQPVQVVSPVAELDWEEIDWRGKSQAEHELRALLHADRRRGFDLSRAPLTRLTLVRLADADYRLIWTFHHIILDGRSFTIVLREAFARYDGDVSSATVDATPAARFAEHVAWVESLDHEASEPFWREQLRGFTAPTPLPASWGPAISAQSRGGEIEHRLSPAVTDALRAWATRHELTMNTVVQGVWSLLLSRQSGERDVVFGVTRAGRRGVAGVDAMVGLLINTLPLRVEVEPDRPLADWLRDVRERWRALRDVEQTPLVRVQGWSELPAGTALFDSLVVFESVLLEDAMRAQGGPWSARGVRVHEQPNFALTLGAYDGASLALKLDHDRSRIGNDTAERVLAQLVTMLEGIAARPDVLVREVPTLPESERHTVLFAWNDTARRIPGTTIHSLVVERAAERPDAIALRDGASTMSYRELMERAARVAVTLRQAGVERGAVVGLLVERSFDFPVGVLGVLQAGGAWLPIDAAYPAERIAFMVEDSGARVVLTQRALASRVPAVAQPFCMEELAPSAGAIAELAGWADECGPDDVAYVIYTSGSTGRPKGTRLAHRGACNLAGAQRDLLGVTPESRVLQFASPGFDASVWEVISALCSGASLQIMPQEVLSSPDELARRMAADGTTIVTLPPTLLRLIDPARIPSLRTVVSAGEALTGDLVARWSAGRRLVNGYGPTETTVCATAAVCTPLDASPPPIGRPLPNTRAYVLDDRGAPVPIGAPGELWIAGAGVALGYLNRPELTAERFARDPFVPHERMYRSGDLVRWRTDGQLEYLGRRDDQVKLRGMRVELGEVEAALAALPVVREVVAMVRRDRGDDRLVAYVVPRDGAALDPVELRDALAATLPEHMIPAAFVAMEKIPLTTSGKVDRRALPAPDDRVATSSFEAPRTATEAIVCRVWAEVLGVEQVGARDSFFLLGGHSLLAARASGRVAAECGVKLPLRTLFESRTVAAYAAAVDAARSASSFARADVRPEAVTAGSATPAQALLWTLQTAMPSDVTYNVPDAVRIEGDVDARALERAMQDLAARHEALRMRFDDAGGAPRFVVEPQVRVPFEVIDLDATPAGERETALQRVLDRAARTPFDLRRAPILRATLVRLSPREHVLVTVTHHVVSDGWSRQLLLRDLGALYEARLRGTRADLPAIAEPYSALLVRAERRRADSRDALLEYWRAQLAGASFAIDLPTDRARPATPSFDGAFRRDQLSPALWQRVESLAQAYDATPYMVLLAAFQTFLHRYSGQGEIVVGSPLAGRTEPASEAHLGYFVNMVALRASFGDEPTFAALLARTRDAVLGAIDHQDAPLPEVAATAGVQPAAGGALVQATFAMQNMTAAELRIGSAVATPRFVHTGTAKFELMLTATPRDGGAELELEYRSDLFDDATIERMLAHLRVLLDGIVAAPETAVSRLPLIDAAERTLVVETFNRTATDYPRDALVPELFAEVAARTPDAIAVRAGDRLLTYRELEAASHALARQLVARGVRPGDRVALGLERSLGSVVATLAVLQVGAAYVPLEPSYPAERLAHMLADAAPTAVVVQPRVAEVVRDAMARAGSMAPVLVVDETGRAEGVSASEVSMLPRVAGVDAGTLAAYVMYTSGSTGRPKGVVVPHRAIVRLVRDTSYLQLTPADVVLGFAPAAFDAATLELWGPLLTGGQLVLAPPGLLDLDALGALVERAGVTALWLTAALFHQVVEGGLARYRGVRALLAGGDVLAPTDVRRVLAALPGCTLINGYGPTENTTFTCCYAVPRDWAGTSSVPIGAPIANTRVYVLDAHGAPVPVGVPGELYAGGDGVALGYLGRDDLTVERFAVHAQWGRLYRTGDRVRWRADGTLEFLGRLDQQVKIRGFRVEPGEVEAVLAEHPGVRHAAVIARRPAHASQHQLVAYVVARESDAPRMRDELKSYLRERVPEALIPSAFVFLDALPVGETGKVDRRALPEPRLDPSHDEQPFVAPRTDAERRIAAIWCEVLGVAQVGVDRNFFELGGDSLLGIQVVARARRTGLVITLKQLFELGTVAAIAAVASEETAAPTVAAATGQFALTPIQRWFFEREIPHREHWNQSFVLTVPPTLDVAALQRALATLEAHHDALRLRFERSAQGWTQRYAEPSGAPPLSRHDLSAVHAAERRAAIERIADEAQTGLDLAHGPLWRCALVTCGAGEPGRLVIAIHHLAVDGVSWPVLLEDLETAYRAAECADRPSLPARTAPYSEWARALTSYATSPAVRREREYWAHALDGVRPLPRDVSGGVTHESRKRTVTATLGDADTSALLREAPAAYNTQVNDLLLAALARTLAGWTDASAVAVDLEAHGREDVVGLDVSRTVGWFTAVHPLRLELGDAHDLRALVKRTKETLRAVPHRGLGYGVLRHLGDAPELAAQPQADIAFNYLGQFDQMVGRGVFALATEQPTAFHDPRGTRRHLLEIDCLVLDGRLEMRWGYSEEAHRPETVERLAESYADALRAITAHCVAPETGGRTASDYPLAALDQMALDALVGSGRAVEDVYPATPLQRLFHTVSQSGGSIGFEQWAYEIEGDVDAAMLREAWQRVVNRHAALRTSLQKASDGRLMQVVLRRADLPFRILDWRDASTDARLARMDGLLAEDRAHPFDVRIAPLMRVTLVRLTDRRWSFVWSQHHLTIDRWSFPILLEEVGAAYRALCARTDDALAPAPAFRDYMIWLAARNADGARSFWEQTLAGLGTPTPLPRGRRRAATDDAMSVQTLRIGADETSRLTAAARARRLTLGTLVQGAWALWLSAQSGRDDVVFGTTLAGRPPEVPGIDRMVGMFINNLPIRARVAREGSVSRFLDALHQQVMLAREFDWTPPDVIHEASGLPGRQRLFDSLVVVQGAAADETARSWLGPDVHIRAPEGVSATGFPLTLFAVEGASLELTLAYPEGRYDSADVRGWLDAVRALLVALGADAARPVGELLALVPSTPISTSDAQAPAAPYVAPRTDTEWVIVAMWGELLGLERVGVHDDFFALGGHSLLLTRLASRVREDLQRDLPLRAFFEAPTVAGIAAALAAGDPASRTERIAAVLRRVAEMSASDVAAATATLPFAPSRETIA